MTKQQTETYTTRQPIPTSPIIDEFIADVRAFVEARLAKHETLGALLDTAAVMDPIPGYLQQAIRDTEAQLVALDAVQPVEA